ncbi:MAG TPA: trypsin-like peptidase domain-containing protein [Ktedonobacteraceae bacterium]
MVQSLYELLQQCTVRISIPQTARGSGVFVAPGLILTCAHVVAAAQEQGQEISITWKDQTFPARIKEYRARPYPDIALLQVDFVEHACVSLGSDVRPFDKLYGYGYPDDYPDGDSVTLSCEGPANGAQPLIKLKRGQLRSGFSGAPLLNIRTGQVCGIIKISRDQETDLGGRAVPVETVLREFAQLVALQQAFHQEHKDWSTGTIAALEVFYSYAHADEDLRKKLDNHLSLLRRQQLISKWYDRDIEAGQEFDREISGRLNTAHIILLLISDAFMGSDYCYEKEMGRAMERHEAGDARVIPVILRPAEWQKAPFGKLVALPRDGKAVTTWPNQDEALLDVAKGIRRVVENWHKPAH